MILNRPQTVPQVSDSSAYITRLVEQDQSFGLQQDIEKQWKLCRFNEKVVYPIAKHFVFGVNRVSEYPYEQIQNFIKYKQSYDLSLWTLTADDHLVQLNRNTNELDNGGDSAFFCFICY